MIPANEEGRVGAPVGGNDVAPPWKTFFWAACVFNFAVGLLGMISPVASVDARIVGLLVFAFGIIYMLVARDPLRYAPVLWAGVVGKVGIVALLGPGSFGAGGEPVVAAALALDGVFALGFLAFLFMRNEEG